MDNKTKQEKLINIIYKYFPDFYFNFFELIKFECGFDVKKDDTSVSFKYKNSENEIKIISLIRPYDVRTFEVLYTCITSTSKLIFKTNIITSLCKADYDDNGELMFTDFIKEVGINREKDLHKLSILTGFDDWSKLEKMLRYIFLYNEV